MSLVNTFIAAPSLQQAPKTFKVATPVHPYTHIHTLMLSADMQGADP